MAESVTNPPPSLIVRTSRTSWTGYGQIGTWLGKLLAAEGIPFHFLGVNTDQRYLPVESWVDERTVKVPPWYATVLQLATPCLPPMGGRRSVVFTMWESSRINPAWVDGLNRAEAIIVPCQFNAEGLRASGVTVPIHVVPLGIDPAEYYPMPWPESKPFTFGMAARMTHGGIRKGINEGMAAFVKAFDRGQDVRLEVKVFEDCLPKLVVPDDPRIQIIATPMTPAGMREWYSGIHCLFVPSKGEGWGMHTHQVMACGRAVIAARHSGTAEFFDGACGWELPFICAPAGEFYTGMGEWAVPTEEGMIDTLRAAFTWPGACRGFGEDAADRAAEFTWERTGMELLAVLASVPDFLPPSATYVGSKCVGS